MKPHNKHELEFDNRPVYAIEFLENPYDGIMVVYNKVSISEGSEEATLHFEYDVVENNGKTYDQKQFEQYLGEFLQELIVEALEDETMIYSGGIDEQNREDDTE